MTSFNLSAWAITHRPLVHYFMAMLVVIGVASYMKLGRNEDPTFTIKAMTVRTQWPGATVNDTLLQITERIERKLQETPYLDYIKSYTNPGQSTIFVYLKGSTGPKEVSDAWYQVRKKIKDIELTLPQGVIGPVSDDEFGDTYGIVYGFTADGFTHRELRDYVEEIRSRLLQVRDVNKVNLIGQQAERIFIEFSPTKLAGYGFKPAELAAALQAQNAVAPTGVITTDEESITLRVSGAMASEKDIGEMNFDVGGRNVRLADIAEVRREYSDPPDPMFRINGTPGLGLSISMRDGGDVLALGENIHHTMEELKADLPIGIEPVMVANQPETVHRSIDEFMEALWESIAIVLVVSVLSLGLRAGAIVIICIPLVLAIVFAAMYALGIDLQRISLGALIISLGLLVDDAMITIESTVFRLERGDDKSKAAIFAYASTALPRLTGTLVTVAAFVPVGFARSDAGEYTFSLFAVVAIALPVGTLKSAGDGRVLYEGESALQYIRVVEEPDGDRVLELNEGQATHSLYRPGSYLTGGYWDGMLTAPFAALGRTPQRVAILGNAAGTTARAYGRFFPEAELHGVEIDPKLEEIGRRYFDMDSAEHLSVFTEDARPWLRRSSGGYDVIVVDAYRQPYIPFYLATREFFDLARERLAPGGVVVVNVGHPDGSDELETVIGRTMADVFESVARDPLDSTNTLLAGSEAPISPDRLDSASEDLPGPLEDLAQEQSRRLERRLPGGMVYTDDRAPVEWLVDRSILGYAAEG